MNHFPDRSARLAAVVARAAPTRSLPLFHEVAVPPGLFAALRDDCVAYVAAALRAADPAGVYDAVPDVLDRYEPQILALPNLTPNGLLLPKRDTYLAYNRLHATVARAFAGMGCDAHVAAIHAPVNVRVISGRRSDRDGRPRASSKLHSDIWAGEFSNTVMLFLTALGDVEHNGVEFMEPAPRFFPEFCRPMADYLEGAGLEADAEQYACSMRTGYAYLTDPFLLHRTVKATDRLRLSIDFRFVAAAACPTDIDVDTDRHKDYIPLADWYDIGAGRLLYTDATVASARAEATGPKNAYAAEFDIRRI